jgi:predicted methyltransferase
MTAHRPHAALSLSAALFTALLLGACATPPQRVSEADVAAIVAAPDRSEADRTNDQRRKPTALFAFVDARPGMRVMDIAAGGGYTSEMLARMVGPEGRVWSQLTQQGSAGPGGQRMAARIKTPPMKNVTLVIRPFDDPNPPEVAPGTLDRVTLMFNYHDLGAMPVDRNKMNRAVFAALKPGGTYIVADHSGRTGTGISEASTLHRIEEAFLRAEVERAGFRLVEEGQFLRNPGDPRSEPTGRPKQPNDEFVLKFAKP